jgi:hypothetical protein
MQYADASEKLGHYRQQIADLRGKMRELQQSVEPVEVSDYEFSTIEGQVRLSELFADKEYLLVIHNMGAGCRYCTLWADGFNGSSRTSKIALPLSSPHPTTRRRSRSSVLRADGISGWCPTATQGLLATWATAATTVGYPGFQYSASAVRRSIASPILVSNPETISVQFGTSSTCCRKGPVIGSPNTNTNDLGGYDGEP